MVFLGEKYVRKLRKMKNERNALIKKHINNFPLARQFALTAFKLQMFGGKKRHVRHPIGESFVTSMFTFARNDCWDCVSRSSL